MHLILCVHNYTGTLILTRLHKKADLLEMTVNGTNIERFVQMKISFDLGKSGGHTPSGLGVGQFLWLGRQAGRPMFERNVIVPLFIQRWESI